MCFYKDCENQSRNARNSGVQWTTMEGPLVLQDSTKSDSANGRHLTRRWRHTIPGQSTNNDWLILGDEREAPWLKVEQLCWCPSCSRAPCAIRLKLHMRPYPCFTPALPCPFPLPPPYSSWKPILKKVSCTRILTSGSPLGTQPKTASLSDDVALKTVLAKWWN